MTLLTRHNLVKTLNALVPVIISNQKKLARYLKKKSCLILSMNFINYIFEIESKTTKGKLTVFYKRRFQASYEAMQMLIPACKDIISK